MNEQVLAARIKVISEVMPIWVLELKKLQLGLDRWIEQK
jgi:hypothetical protein